MKTGIIGAGLAGLTAGRILARHGHDVTICELAPEPGGLAGTFLYANTRLEKFYHHYFTSDLNTIQLLKDLGLESKMIWKETPMGIFTQGRLYKFSTPWDLLRFKPLSFFNRLRFGLVTLLLSKVKNWSKYEDVQAGEWIKKAYGRQAWDVIWGPLLHGKFGDYALTIGMPWFYSRIHTRAGSREKGMAKESLGYLQGGFQVMHDALQKDMENHGASLQFNTAVNELNIKDKQIQGWTTDKGKQTFDQVLVTCAPQEVMKILPREINGEYWENMKSIEYYGNICAILTLKRSLTPIYWMNIPDTKSPFIAVIEHTNFIDKENYQGKQVLYLSSYLSTEHPRYKAADKTVLQEFYDYLKKVIPSFSANDVADYHLFRAPCAQPIIRAGYGKKIGAIQTPVKGLFVANMAQIYPEDRGMSYSIRLGEQAAKTILDYIGK